MTHTAIIDEDIRGWVTNDNRGHIPGYDKVLLAGMKGDLPWLDSDSKIASFCKENNYDLFTSDKMSYTHYFDDKTIHTILITNYAYWGDGKKNIFMIRIPK